MTVSTYTCRVKLVVPTQNTYGYTHSKHQCKYILGPIWTCTYIHIHIYKPMVNSQPYAYVFTCLYIHTYTQIYTHTLLMSTHMYIGIVNCIYYHSSIYNVTVILSHSCWPILAGSLDSKLSFFNWLPNQSSRSSLYHYLPIAGRGGGGEEMDSCLSKGITTKWNVNSLVQDLDLLMPFH